jgi:hypothetical protein
MIGGKFSAAVSYIFFFFFAAVPCLAELVSD